MVDHRPLARSGARFGRPDHRIGRQFAGSRVPWVLGRLVARRWGVALGVSDRGLALTGVALLAGLAAIGWRVADRWSPTVVDGLAATEPAESVLLGVAVSLWALAVAFGIFASHAATVPPCLRFLRTLPVSRRQVGRAATLPLAVLALGAVVAVGPLVVSVTTAATGRGPAHAITPLVLIAAAGVALGTTLHRWAARLLAAPGWGSLRLTTAYLCWCVAVVASVVAPLALLQRLGPTPALVVLAPLGWPLAWWALIDGRPEAALGALAVTVALCATAARLQPAPADAGRARASVRQLAVGRPLPIARVQVRRLARHPRVLEALVVAGFFGLVLAIGAAWLARRLPGAMSPALAALLGAQISAAPAALARGLSDRRRPAEAALGIGAGAHVVALVGASLSLCAIAAAPALAVSVVLLPAPAGAGWLGALPMLAAVGVLVSCVLTPELGNGSAEGGAVLAYAAASTGVLALLDRLPDIGGGAVATIPAVLLLSLAALAAIAAATALERRHRRPT